MTLSMTMEHIIPQELYTCDGCESTVYCSQGDLLQKWKWRRYIGKTWRLLLCPDCQAKAR